MLSIENGSRYIFTLQLYCDNYVLCYEPGSDQGAKDSIAGRILIPIISCYITTSTPNNFQRKILLELFVFGAPTDLTKLKVSVS